MQTIRITDENLWQSEQMLIVASNPRALEYVKQTDVVCKIAIERSWEAIQYVKNQTLELCLLALKGSVKAFELFEEEFRTPTCIAEYAKVRPELLDFTVDVLKTVSENGMLLEYVKGYASDEIKIAAVKQNGLALKFVENPTEFMCSLAIEQNWESIQYCKNPTKEMQLLAVKQSWEALKFIEKQIRVAQLVSVKQSWQAIQYCKNPTEKVQLVAVKQAWEAIKYCKNPTEKVQLVAIEQSWKAIQCIRDPTEKVQLVAVKQSWEALEHVSLRTDEIQLVAVKQSWQAIKYCENPTKQVQIVAVEQSWEALKFIQEPTYDAYLIALKQSWTVLTRIKVQSEEMQIIAIKQNIDALDYIYGMTDKVRDIGLSKLSRYERSLICREPCKGLMKLIQARPYLLKLVNLNEFSKHLTRKYGVVTWHMMSWAERTMRIALAHDPDMFHKYDVPEDLRWLVLRYDPYFIYEINKPTKYDWEDAIKAQPKLIKDIDNPCELLVTAAVCSYWKAIKWVKQTEALCLIAVSTTPDALKYCEFQTEAVCRAALKQNPLAIEHVVKPTGPIAFYAIERNPNAFKYIRCKETKELVSWAPILYSEDLQRKKGIKEPEVRELAKCWKSEYYFLQYLGASHETIRILKHHVPKYMRFKAYREISDYDEEEDTFKLFEMYNVLVLS